MSRLWPTTARARAHTQIKACMMAMQNFCKQLIGAIKVGAAAPAMCTNIVQCMGTPQMERMEPIFRHSKATLHPGLCEMKVLHCSFSGDSLPHVFCVLCNSLSVPTAAPTTKPTVAPTAAPTKPMPTKVAPTTGPTTQVCVR
jgi:hypothetical protein